MSVCSFYQDYIEFCEDFLFDMTTYMDRFLSDTFSADGKWVNYVYSIFNLKERKLH